VHPSVKARRFAIEKVPASLQERLGPGNAYGVQPGLETGSAKVLPQPSVCAASGGCPEAGHAVTLVRSLTLAHGLNPACPEADASI
jgi:hypothetical protein